MPKLGTPAPPYMQRQSHPHSMLTALAIMYDIDGEVRAALAERVEPKLSGTLGEILKQSRKVSGLTVQAIHRRSGISRSQLQMIEADEAKNPGVSLLQRTAHGYGLPFIVVLLGAMRTNDLCKSPARKRTRCVK